MIFSFLFNFVRECESYVMVKTVESILYKVDRFWIYPRKGIIHIAFPVFKCSCKVGSKLRSSSTMKIPLMCCINAWLGRGLVNSGNKLRNLCPIEHTIATNVHSEKNCILKLFRKTLKLFWTETSKRNHCLLQQG